MKKLYFIFFIILLILTPTFFCRAIEFNPHYIISDAEFTDATALTQFDIQQFLNYKNSYLAKLYTADADGQIKSAAEIIYQASQRHQINPKVLLVMLQKEQSLITDKSPEQKQLDWAMGYGICDDCSFNDPALAKFQGFGNQVEQAAARFRWYYNNPKAYHQVGQKYLIDGQYITISNQATANLYNYTPHILGNYNFWKIWQQWFNQYHQDGAILKVKDQPGIWLIEYGFKRPFLNWSAFISRYEPSKIIIVEQNELEKYETGSPIAFANYSLLTVDGKIYLLVDNKLRPIDNLATFRLLGYNPEELIPITNEDLKNFELGEIITSSSVYPFGILLQNNITGGVYYVQNGYKQPIIDRDILLINFPNQKILQVTPAELDKYKDGDSIKIKNGELVKTKTDPRVYLISRGEKCLIKDENTFNKLGYSWTKIRTVSDKALSNLPDGDIIDIKYKSN